MSDALPNSVVDAWQAALAAEQQAAFGYALLGPRLSATKQQDLARSCQDTHADIRDTTADAISAAGRTPVAPEGDYPALYPVVRRPLSLAAELEDQCAAAWRYLYSVAATTQEASPADTAPLRMRAQQNLTASAVRATRWRVQSRSTRPTAAFPGV